jgi:hypothetical protein
VKKRSDYSALQGAEKNAPLIPPALTQEGSEVPRAVAFPAYFAGAGRSEGSAVCEMPDRNKQIAGAKTALQLTVQDFLSSLFSRGPFVYGSAHLQHSLSP